MGLSRYSTIETFFLKSKWDAAATVFVKVLNKYYNLLALTRKICGILSKKLQKLALLKL